MPVNTYEIQQSTLFISMMRSDVHEIQNIITSDTYQI